MSEGDAEDCRPVFGTPRKVTSKGEEPIHQARPLAVPKARRALDKNRLKGAPTSPSEAAQSFTITRLMCQIARSINRFALPSKVRRVS